MTLVVGLCFCFSAIYKHNTKPRQHHGAEAEVRAEVQAEVVANDVEEGNAIPRSVPVLEVKYVKPEQHLLPPHANMVKALPLRSATPRPSSQFPHDNRDFHYPCVHSGFMQIPI